MVEGFYITKRVVLWDLFGRKNSPATFLFYLSSYYKNMTTSVVKKSYNGNYKGKGNAIDV